MKLPFEGGGWGRMGQRLRIATYNIHGWVDEGYDSNLERVVQLVNSYDPDVLCLQEVTHVLSERP